MQIVVSPVVGGWMGKQFGPELPEESGGADVGTEAAGAEVAATGARAEAAT